MPSSFRGVILVFGCHTHAHQKACTVFWHGITENPCDFMGSRQQILRTAGFQPAFLLCREAFLKCKLRSHILEGSARFELALTVPQTAVLPLHQRPIFADRLFLKLPLSFSLRYCFHDSSCFPTTSNGLFKILSTRPTQLKKFCEAKHLSAYLISILRPAQVY